MFTPDTGDTGPVFAPHVLREYALLADGERGALIGPHGDIAWMCAPRWDSDAVFSALVGGGGSYAVTPLDPRHVWGGFYETGSLIWHSRFITGEGPVECREALAFPGESDRVVLLRRILATDCPARVRIVLEPRGAFGGDSSHDVRQHHDLWSGKTGPLNWRWSGAAEARATRTPDGGGEVLTFELTVPPGRHHDLVLELSPNALSDEPVQSDAAWAATEASWARNCPTPPETIATRDAHHALAVLRGLTSRSGGMVAAATMCLPERAGAGRNYDYRYAWIRDQCYAGIAAAGVGATGLVDSAVGFVSARLLQDGPELKPAYTVSGRAVPSEQTLDLPGYPGGTDKIGNWVNQQFQLDTYGEALQLLATAGHSGRLDPDGRRAVHVAVTAVEQLWNRPDAGIWEIDDRHWTHSKLSCVAGLRAVAALPGAGREVGRLTSLADTILADTARTSLHPDGHWKRAADMPGVDASLLMPPVRGALPGDDPRTVATLRAVRRELARDEYVYRFRHDDGPLAEAEGAFLLCGFLMALAEHQQGNTARALRFFERNRAACGPPGLFAEEYDIIQRQLRGNLPQAFVHALLLECAARLSEDPPPPAQRERG
ncbi:glycoside hydrolase family 15 protein [Streptomyces sp. BA2]|uniref:glycoside hydrolase family 15 protein n=1 Tax=Streptomyces sp. BA2 TaxID=436595 RepID=UPI00132642CD|nr:glycoside hydrolase family 15 protein [Streptomyces sp. BA2]MWA08444.1 glycoside hydrolase family 15 protein [Streptomyces sp. BA2]